MKLCVCSSAFASAFRRGVLTHLEWLEGCASRLDADGVVFALGDFPRTDLEYAAQVKKIAVDLGLVPVALDALALLDPASTDDERIAAVDLAAALGAFIVRTSTGAPGDLPPQTFAQTVAAAKAMAKAAKARNVTLAVGAHAGSLIASVADLRHLAKDVDSAWLRYDVAFDDPQRATFGPRERVLIERVAIDRLADAPFAERRGWFALEGDAGDDPFATVAAAITNMRERAMTTAGAVCIPG